MTVPWPTTLWLSFAPGKPRTAGINNEINSVEAAVAQYGMVNEDEGHSMVRPIPSHEEEDDSHHLPMFFCPVPQLDLIISTPGRQPIRVTESGVYVQAQTSPSVKSQAQTPPSVRETGQERHARGRNTCTHIALFHSPSVCTCIFVSVPYFVLCRSCG